MSSTIWKASPTSLAYRSSAVTSPSSAPRHDRAAGDGRADDRAGLARVHRAEAVGVERQGVSWSLTRRLQVDGLAADHARRAGRVADDAHDAQLAADDRRIVGRRLARQQREGLGLQAVAGENRNAVAVDHVQRRPSAPQRVVVHGGEIVVNQRVGVDQLDGARGRQRRSNAGR